MEALTSQAPRGCMPPWWPTSAALLRAWRCKFSPNLAWACTLPATGSFLQRATHSIVKETVTTPCTAEQECGLSGLREGGAQGTKSRPRSSLAPPRPPAQDSPPAPRDPGERLGCAAAERTSEPVTISPCSSLLQCACAARAGRAPPRLAV